MNTKQINQALTFFNVKSLSLALILGPVASLSASAYNLIDLGANVAPKAINNAGEVVGSSNTNQYPATAFRWSSGSGIELINGTSANAVNDAGLIAGTTITGAFIMDNNYREWSGYGAFGVNQLGEVAGYKVGNNPYQPRSLPYNPAIFNGTKWDVFDIARLYSRGTRKGVYADRFILNGINTGGYTVGYKYRYGLAGSAAILIDPNVVVNDLSDVVYLPTPAGGRAADINDNKIITGTTGSNSRTTPITYSQAYIYNYDASNLTILPVLEGGLRSSANDINEINQVVGSSETSTGNHAFIWDDANGIVDLNTMVSATGWVLTSAMAINDNNEIVGTGLLNGVTHGFVLSNGTISEPPPVQNQQPEAKADADVTEGKAALEVSFTGEASSDPDGTIVMYEWDFGDLTSSNEMNPVHTYTDPGKYLATLKVTDDQASFHTDQLEITVKKSRRKK